MLPFMCQSKLFYKPFFFYLLNKLILTINSSLIILFRKTNFKFNLILKGWKKHYWDTLGRIYGREKKQPYKNCPNIYRISGLMCV